MSSALKLARALARGETRLEPLCAAAGVRKDAFRKLLAKLRAEYGLEIEAPGNRTYRVTDWGVFDPKRLAQNP